MVRRIRSLLFIVSLIGIIACLVLMSNSTAPNPTHRRYSSSPPILSNGGDAERILSMDLGIPNNNSADQRQCLCQSGARTIPSSCRVCVMDMSLSYRRTYRIPDFLTNTFIADSKNQQVLQASSEDFWQMTDYAVAATKLHIPLYVFIRMDTRIDDAYYPLIAGTGGAIIRYFTIPGYVDPVEQASKIGAYVFVALGVLSLVRLPLIRWSRPALPTPPLTKTADRKAQDALSDAAELSARMKDKHS